ncbi:hypothetical protein NXC14_CH03837 [Rhizobium sp. NXC14]|uniref:DUF4238 domain-containing protein n=1 Tax=Rhizobium sp. NXC14 TaxID=1981173 RepID=UPI000A207AD7|nr:DUF4238 domain-containing protein [Rhizobium sp. NXC14]ARO31722.1 hypothetical protein NXC14_CH03837 [Rhizobium sp. NXC14]
MMTKPDSQKQNPSHKHHYIPQFYMKRWTGGDGQLEIYEKHPRGVNNRRGAPKSTGYQRKLYAMDGFPNEEASAFEKVFFEPADTKASLALAAMERGKFISSTELRSGWSRFLMGLLLRCPEDVAIFRDNWDDYLSDTSVEIEERYAAQRKKGDPETLVAMIKSRPLKDRQLTMFRIFKTLLDHKNVGNHINQMEWQVLDLSDARFQLLTSDRPIVRTNGLKGEGGHLGLAVSPTALFVATNTKEFMKQILRADPNELVRANNERVVEGAAKYVYAADRTQARFIQNHIGRIPEPRLIEGIFRRRQTLSVG